MKKILVTGGAGFIGSCVCQFLANEGYGLLVVDSLIRGSKERIQHCPLRIGDITNIAFMEDIFKEFAPDSVVHLAAYCNPWESMQQPQLYYRNNMAATLVLLDAMVRHGVKEVVFASSSTVYAAQPQFIPYTEKNPLGSNNPYATSKWMGERLIEDYSKAYGLRYVIMRHFNPAGADAGSKIGELLTGNSHAVAALIKVALGIAPLFKFYGIDYPTPDGSSIRDYVHVNDIARAHVHAMRYQENHGDSLTVNIGTGQGTSLKQLLAAVESYCGHAIPVEYKPCLDIFQPYLVADVSSARKVLGWEPVQSSIDNIIETTFCWFTDSRGKLQQTA